MASKISGELVDEAARIIIIDESNWTVESNTEESQGQFSIEGLSEGYKTVIARTPNGLVKAYGNVEAEITEVTLQLYCASGAHDGRWTSAGTSDFIHDNIRDYFGRVDSGGTIRYNLFFHWSLPIPKDATIISANLRYYEISGCAGSGGFQRMYIHDVDDSPLPTSQTMCNNVYLNSIQSTVWYPSGSVGWKSGPSMKNQLQSVVNRSGWSSGNSITIVTRGENPTDCRRRMWMTDYNYAPNRPYFEVVYET
jgi:hypothetical protein